MKAISTVLAALALLGSAAPALAQEAPSATLRYGDLDLGGEAGKATLERRIDQAARQVCASITVTGSRVSEAALRNRCESDARAQAHAQLSTQLTARITRRSD